MYESSCFMAQCLEVFVSEFLSLTLLVAHSFYNANGVRKTMPVFCKEKSNG